MKLVIISGSHNDELHLKAYTDASKHKSSIKSFKLPFDVVDEGISGNVGIVVVNNMLLTGFDAPVEQVMYLDKIIIAHTLLQAIARVNRVGGPAKEKGFVVDYVGVGHHLKKALDNYDEREQNEILEVLSFPEEELRELEASHAAIMDFLKAHGLTDLVDHDAFFDIFYDEDLRFEYITLFKKFTKCLNLVFPAKEALEFMAYYERLSEINVLAENFQKDVKSRNRTKTKAAEIEHAIRHHLDVDLDDDPDLQASFAEALKRIFEDFRDNWNAIYEELEKLRRRIVNADKEPTYGLHRKKQMPLFRMLKKEIFGDAALDDDGISSLVALTQQVFADV